MISNHSITRNDDNGLGPSLEKAEENNLSDAEQAEIFQNIL